MAAGHEDTAADRPHNAVIRAHFTDHLTPEELRELGGTWEKILRSGKRAR